MGHRRHYPTFPNIRFTAKVRSLYDFQLRLMQGILPPPSGVDIANTIKYFSQTLLSVLKDVPNSPHDLLKDPQMDGVRMGLFPSLDYKGLYNSIIPLIEVAPLITNGLHAFGEAVLHCLGCLLPFLEHDLIDNLPYLTASTIAVLPPSLHKEIINTLCYYILPFTITRRNPKRPNVSQSVASVIMMIFQYSNNPAHHCQLLECLMTLKHDILKDMLSAIAYGTSISRASAAKLLFYYWPTFNPNLFDRRNLICKFAEPTPFVCQRDECPNAGIAEAAKVCYDHSIAIMFSTDIPPPLYLCIECANDIHRDHPNQNFFDILHPMQQVSMVCENKNCRSGDKSAISICFSTECASYNGNHPIRFCEQCHNNRHNSRRGGDHVVHKSIPPTWEMDVELQTCMVEAIVSLLEEAKIPESELKELDRKDLEEKNDKKDSKDKDGKSPIPASENIGVEERQLLGRYGVWLLVGRCSPTENAQIEVLGRLLSMIFHWFHMTAYSYDGREESALERLKTVDVRRWLNEICKSHYDLFVSCLLPHPPDYARIGGHWDTLATKTTHLKEGLDRLFCLVPYDIITQEIWDFIMPHWMEATVDGVPEKELAELKIVLSKILDPDLSPLGFDAKKMYQFVAIKFQKTSAKIQQQAVKWLQILTLLDISIPLHLLFSIFNDGIAGMKDGDIGEAAAVIESEVKGKKNFDLNEIQVINDSPKISPPNDDSVYRTHYEEEAENNLSCCILMLDILLKQMELQEIDKHTGLNSSLCKNVCSLFKNILTAGWISSHVCFSKTDCTYCECSIMWHQLAYELVIYLSPLNLAHPPDPPPDSDSDDAHSRKSPPENDKKDKSNDATVAMPMPEVHSVGGVLVHMPHVCSIMTATVETVSEQLDLASILPADKVNSTSNKANTLSESDITTTIASTSKAQASATSNNNHEQIDTDSDDMDFWQTSIGKFRFSLDDLSEPLQYIHQLLLELQRIVKPDIHYYMLKCLNVLILYGDACTKASKDNKGYFIWCQENLIIKNLWNLLRSEHSHICQEAVPLILHCITLPAGSDVFWRIIQKDFHSNDWKIRFTAVEKVTVLARFMADCPLRNQFQLQAALANAFCYLISSMDDPNVYIAQRATLYLGTIHDYAIRSLIMCLETQFDSVILDRPMVLQSIYQLHNSLSERKILNWNFFLNRFDTLFIEAQIVLERAGEISYIRDLKNTDINCESFLKKLHRAHDALSALCETTVANSTKTLSASFGTKWPYKRTMSAPASIIRHQENKSAYIPDVKEKIYSRQYSAPILKRKTSRFGLDSHIHSLNVVDDHNITTFLQKVIDLEEADEETMHLLIFLLMQFLSRADQAYPAEDKHLARIQTIVLKHLWLLLGYSQTDKGIYLPPTSLRASPAFNVFISTLPQLMDQNHIMGKILLPTSLIILQYAPSPSYISSSTEFQQPLYSLWTFEPHTRRCWLMSLVVLLYKYQYNHKPQSIQLSALIKIVVNTLDSQQHHCKRIPDNIILSQHPSRSRDVSQPSLGADIDLPDRVTPPLSPMYSSDGQSIHISLNSKGGKVLYAKPSSLTSMETHWEESNCNEKSLDKKQDKNTRKNNDKISTDDDTESELLAIPESDISDSTLHESVQDSLEEVISDSSGPGLNKIFMETIPNNHSLKEQNVSEEIEMKALSSTNNRPIWIIGSEDESLRSYDNVRTKIDYNKNITKIKSTSSSASTNFSNDLSVPSATLKAVAAVSQKVHDKIRATPLGRHKKIIEPFITSVSTPTADYDSIKNNNFPTPIIERLLPIGPIKSPDLEVYSNFHSQLTIPTQERLLPIGSHVKEITSLVEKVKHAFNINVQLSKIVRRSEHSEKKLDLSLQMQSPRKLTKQVALESPPNVNDCDMAVVSTDSHLKRMRIDSQSNKSFMTRQRIRKTGPFIAPSKPKPQIPGNWADSSQSDSPLTEANGELKQSLFRIGDESIKERCSECGCVKEFYSNEEVGLCIIILGTFIHREPSLAAPMLPDILDIVAKIATNTTYPWQSENNVHLPGGAISVALQFIRCVLHQLAPNGVFMQIFQTRVSDRVKIPFFKSVIQALLDFNELNPVTPLQLVLENLNTKKNLPVNILPILLLNLATYISCLPLETALGQTASLWSGTFQQLEILFRKIFFILNALHDVSPLLNIMVSLLKMPLISQFRSILEPFSKILSYAVQTQNVKYNVLVDICYLCNKAYARERDKLIFSRMLVFELVQALKFKSKIPDSNLLLLINMVLQDIGGQMPANVIVKDNIFAVDYSTASNTAISECMRLNLGDILEYLSDFHTFSKSKSHSKGIGIGLNEDTLGGITKCNLAQYLTLEITKGNGRDNKFIIKYFPWLFSSSTTQQNTKEFLECIGHIRLLSWLLLGALTHAAVQEKNGMSALSQPIPHEASCQIADSVQVILSGFAEQPKANSLQRASMFHTFILCQLWTIYLEQSLCNHLPITEAYNVTMNILFDFWGKVTPCILQLVQQSKVFNEIVSLHFLSMLEALIECHSTFVFKLLPLWAPVLLSCQLQVPGHLKLKLQNSRKSRSLSNQEMLHSIIPNDYSNSEALLKWLQRLQFKMGQIELQSSTTTQFYSL